MSLAKPDLLGLIPKVALVTNLKGGVIEEPLPEAETPASWLPPKAVTQVWIEFI